MAEQVMWAIKRPTVADDPLMDGTYSAIGITRVNAWNLHYAAQGVERRFPEATNGYWEARGYSLVQVRVTEVPSG